ncbi:hypothetical protein ILUMI_21436 [Ignelater luminosus]|uniref:Uncharacterized protein n=1 Tax=Ignelater luminosus TaxID=2038154 RepID=A0A8K0CIV3_IGNLU|nr:hypothetical protein ILUMI_21436 [Ignelater luminosus]
MSLRWGGWCERLIGVLKTLLRRILGRSMVTYKKMAIILCDCESVINNHPVTYLSQDSSDLALLTTSLFLQEVKEIGVSDIDLIESTHLNRRFRLRQHLKNTLCERFRTEYSRQLKLFSAKASPKEVSVGEIVLIGNNGSKRID